MEVRVKCQVSDGLIPTERTVLIENSKGVLEEVMVSAKSIEEGALCTHSIGFDSLHRKHLVELPRESTSGRWRIWVNESTIL